MLRWSIMSPFSSPWCFFAFFSCVSRSEAAAATSTWKHSSLFMKLRGYRRDGTTEPPSYRISLPKSPPTQLLFFKYYFDLFSLYCSSSSSSSSLPLPYFNPLLSYIEAVHEGGGGLETLTLNSALPSLTTPLTPCVHDVVVPSSSSSSSSNKARKLFQPWIHP